MFVFKRDIHLQLSESVNVKVEKSLLKPTHIRHLIHIEKIILNEMRK